MRVANKPVKFDGTNRIKNKTNMLINNLYKKQYINYQTKCNLISHAPIAPNIYGLLKTHKPGNPIRLVTSFVQSPTCNLSKFVATILKYASTNDFDVLDSFDF